MSHATDVNAFSDIKIRRRVIAYSAVMNIVNKGQYFLLVYLAFSWTLPYLGPERFGVFSTLLGFGSILAILDLGIGNVLIGSVARLSAAGDPQALAREIAGGLLILSALAVILFCALSLAVHLLPIGWLFKNLAAEHHAEARSALHVFVAAYSVTLPLQGMQRITQGLQRAYVAHAWGVVFTGMALVALYFATRSRANITLLIALAYALPATAPIGTGPMVARVARQARIASIDFGEMIRRFGSQGSIYFLLQLGALAGWGSDAVLAASQLGPVSAGLYSIAQRLFQLVSYPLAILNTPLWPAYADAVIRDDRDFISKTLASSFYGTAAAAALGVSVILLFSGQVFELWLHQKPALDRLLLIACGSWAVVEACGVAYAMFLNGANLLKIQLWSTAAFVVLALLFKVSSINALGLIALPLSTLLAYLLSIIIPYALFLRPHAPWVLER